MKTILTLNPNLKIVYLARNPIDHAWSFTKHANRYRKHSFSSLGNDVSKLSPEILFPFLLSDFAIAVSDHFLTLNRLLSVFPKENIHVYFFEEIVKNPTSVLC